MVLFLESHFDSAKTNKTKQTKQTKQTKMKLFSLLGFLSALTLTFAWGPVSHYQFSCQSMVPPLGPIVNCQCLNSTSEEPHEKGFLSSSSSDLVWDADSLLMGSDFPDALYFGANYFTGSSCPLAAADLHDPLFAGLLVRSALKSNNGTLVSFAAGFAAHVAADLLGFGEGFQQQFVGYLGNASGVIDWITEWSFMTAVDARVLQSLGGRTPRLPSRPVPTSILGFFSEVSLEYGTWISVGNLSVCAGNWATAINQFNKLSSLQTPESTERQLLFFDRWNASSGPQALQNLERALQCASAAARYYLLSLIEQGDSPEVAYTMLAKYVTQLIKEKGCGLSL